MPRQFPTRFRAVVWLTLVILLGLTAFAVILIVPPVQSAVATLRASDYPAADITADRLRFDTSSTAIQLRRNTAYRTTDTFPDVYQWYSIGFGLGPEQAGHNDCILMANTQTTSIFEQHMAVTVCESNGARRVFVQRSLGLRLTRP